MGGCPIHPLLQLPTPPSTQVPPLPPVIQPSLPAAVPPFRFDNSALSAPTATQIVSLTVPLTQPEAGPSHVLDATPNPRFASQMAPIFYSKIEEHVRREKEKQEQEELRREAIVRAKHEVTVFGWGTVCISIQSACCIYTHLL